MLENLFDWCEDLSDENKIDFCTKKHNCVSRANYDSCDLYDKEPSNNQYVLVITDRFSTLVGLEAIKHVDEQTI